MTPTAREHLAWAPSGPRPTNRPEEQVTKPSNRDERLRDILSTTVGICYGMGGYDERLVAFGSGFPAGSGGGGSKGTVSRPVENLALERYEAGMAAKADPKKDQHSKDPAARAQAEFDKKLEAAQRALEAVWVEYANIVQPRAGVAKVTDPGCELCAQVPDNCERCRRSGMDDHWCPTYATVDVTVVSKRKDVSDKLVKVRLCTSCYDGRRRVGRLLTHDEVLDHVEGRRRRWKVGA